MPLSLPSFSADPSLGISAQFSSIFASTPYASAPSCGTLSSNASVLSFGAIVLFSGNGAQSLSFNILPPGIGLSLSDSALLLGVFPSACTPLLASFLLPSTLFFYYCVPQSAFV